MYPAYIRSILCPANYCTNPKFQSCGSTPGIRCVATAAPGIGGVGGGRGPVDSSRKVFRLRNSYFLQTAGHTFETLTNVNCNRPLRDAVHRFLDALKR